MALDRAIEVNAAWRKLRDPVQRAEALLQRAGVSVGEEAEPKPSPSLLMEMMEVRESLAEARGQRDLDAIGRLSDGMRDKERAALNKLSDGFAGSGDVSALVPIVGELRYFRRFFEEVEAIEEQLLD